MSCQLQATLGTTSPGTWIEWTVVPDQVWDSTDPGVIRESDHGETEGNGAKVETLGEGSDVSQGAGEGTGGEETGASFSSTKEKDGEGESVRRELFLGIFYRRDLLRTLPWDTSFSSIHEPAIAEERRIQIQLLDFVCIWCMTTVRVVPRFCKPLAAIHPIGVMLSGV